MTRLYLVRHGKVDAPGIFYGQLDVSLSEQGRQQLQAVAVALAGEDLEAVYSSDLRRTVEGARQVAEPHGIEVQPDEAFREMHLGVLEGLRWDELPKRHPEFAHKRYRDMCDFAFPGGETMRQVEARVLPALQRLRRRHPKGSVVLVAHNSVNRVVLGQALGLPLEGVFDFAQDFGGLNRIHYGEAVRVELLNWTTAAPLPSINS